MHGINTKVAAALLADPEWRRRLEQAKTGCEVDKVLVEFCKAKGYRLAEVATA